MIRGILILATIQRDICRGKLFFRVYKLKVFSASAKVGGEMEIQRGKTLILESV